MKHTAILEEHKRCFLNNSLFITCKFLSPPAISQMAFTALFSTAIPKKSRISRWKQTFPQPRAGTEVVSSHVMQAGWVPGASLDTSQHQALKQKWHTHSSRPSQTCVQRSETSKATSARSRNCFLSQNMPNCQIACDLSQLPLAILLELPSKPRQKPQWLKKPLEEKGLGVILDFFFSLALHFCVSNSVPNLAVKTFPGTSTEWTAPPVLHNLNTYCFPN